MGEALTIEGGPLTQPSPTIRFTLPDGYGEGAARGGRHRA